MDLLIIETPSKTFISDVLEEWHSSSLESYFINGKKPEKSFKKNWFIIDKFPEIVEREVTPPHINERYELIDMSMASDKIKKRLEIGDIKIDSNGYWKDEFAPLRSLYTRKWDTPPPVMQTVEFTVREHRKIDVEVDFFGFKYAVKKTQWDSDGFIDLTQEDVSYDLLDEIQSPSLLLPLRPAFLTSSQSYKIIRKYVQDNINPKAASITSDYDFCFTVQRKIKIEPIKYTYDANNSIFDKKKKRPKYITAYRNDRKVTLFEMTTEEKPYQGYTPIKGFSGQNVKELKENIDKFLSELMEIINKETKDCPTCNGCGIIEI